VLKETQTLSFILHTIQYNEDRFHEKGKLTFILYQVEFLHNHCKGSQSYVKRWEMLRELELRFHDYN